MVIVSGLYDPAEDEEGFPALSIILHYNPTQKQIQLRNIDIVDLAVDVISVIMHEECHQRQHRAREFRAVKCFRSKHPDTSIRAEQEYLGHNDEVEAYACGLACEVFIRNNFSVPESTTKAIKNNYEYKNYCRVFGSRSKIVRKLMDHSLRFLAQFKNDATCSQELALVKQQ
jgi:hypothetical protein